jgi:hypothetical protein
MLQAGERRGSTAIGADGSAFATGYRHLQERQTMETAVDEAKNRGFGRFLLFTDIVMAIAVTPLILPEPRERLWKRHGVAARFANQQASSSRAHALANPHPDKDHPCPDR